MAVVSTAACQLSGHFVVMYGEREIGLLAQGPLGPLRRISALYCQDLGF